MIPVPGSAKTTHPHLRIGSARDPAPTCSCRDSRYTVCPGSSDPFYIVKLLYKMDSYFLDCISVPDPGPVGSVFFQK